MELTPSTIDCGNFALACKLVDFKAAPSSYGKGYGEQFGSKFSPCSQRAEEGG